MENETIENLRDDHALDERKRKKKKRLRIVLIVVGIILAVVAYFVLSFFFAARNAFEEMYRPFGDDVVNMREETGELELGDDPFSVLILGLDEGRTDSIMVATVNPNLGTTYLLSLARDTMVDIPGFGVTRINHAYAYGGLDLAVNTVQDFLDIPIDYHATLDMDYFYLLVNAFGGLRVYNNTVEFSMYGHHFPLGYIDLTGEAAYFYVRMRMDDPRGDYGRQERQRDVLGAMANELAGVTVITRYQQILDSVGEAMQTNVSLNEMMTISMNYNTALRNITNLDLHEFGQIINGMYLIPIPEERRLEMSQRLRAHLELD